jgi:hypothetical protein
MWKRFNTFPPAACLLTFIAYPLSAIVRGRHPDLGIATGAALGNACLLSCISLALALLRVGATEKEPHDFYEHLRNNRIYLILGSAAGAWVSAQVVFDAFR